MTSLWVGGRVVPSDSLAIRVHDRTFEHGLGLFETLRTWNGRVPLLRRHLARMSRSAEELGIPLDRNALPNASAIAELLHANQIAGEALIRISLSGGRSSNKGSTLWMSANPLRLAATSDGLTVDVGGWDVVRNDPLARHKTLNYWRRRIVFESAQRSGFDEALSTTDDGRVWEGSRTNLFCVQGTTLRTPTLLGPLVPGIMRAVLLELAADQALEVIDDGELTRDELRQADEVFLTNSVRGIRSVSRMDGRTWEKPGSWAQQLSAVLSDRMQIEEVRDEFGR
ncbi:aminotransferase class IV [Singulisphaera rosea]